jgi:hypothetical protein
MTQGHNAADKSLIVPVSIREIPNNFQKSAVRADAREKQAIDCEGFIRLTTEEFQESAIDIIKRVMFKGDRFLLQQTGEDVGAIVPEAEFHKLDYWMAEIKPSQFMPEEEEYYADVRGIHCIYPDEVLADFDNILADVKEFDELFGLLPISEMGRDVDIYMPVAILMSADRFWVAEYVIAEKNSWK